MVEAANSIATLQCVDRLAENLLGEAAHLRDVVVEEGKLLLVGPDDVLVLLFHHANSQAAD